jgi:hypothetical protein
MAENITTRLGERGAGGFEATCPRGGHITGFYGSTDTFLTEGTYITSIGAKCSDGSDLGKYGGSGTFKPSTWVVNQTKPFYNFSGAYRKMARPMITKFMENGTMDGIAWSANCPSGVAVGVYGNAGENINSFGLECGVPINYCMENLEDPACADINDDDLNKVCSLNFTKTCFEKKDSLEPETIKAYCKNNPTNSICSKSMASYIPNSAPTDPNGVYTRPPIPSDIANLGDIASTSNILILLVVVVFGGVIAFMLLKDKPAKSTSSQPYNQQTQAQPYNQQTQSQPYYQQPQVQPYNQQTQSQPYYQQPQAQPYYQPPPRG